MQRLNGSHALRHMILADDEVDHARGREGEADEDCLGAHNQRCAMGEVNQRPGEAGYELWGVFIGKCELEGKCGKDESYTAADGEGDGKAVERLHKLPVDPEICNAHKDPEMDRLSVQEDLHDIWIAGEFLASLVPAPDDSCRYCGENER